MQRLCSQQRPESALPCGYSWPRSRGVGGTQGCLLWSGTPIGSADHLTLSPGSGFDLLHYWGRCLALEASRAAGYWL